MPKADAIPKCPDLPAIGAQAHATREYQIQLVTPLFGGGVKAGEPDPSLPIRATSIRGQLRFWWRATRGASCSSAKELFARSAAVWGTTEKASPVEIAVPDFNMVAPRPCVKYSPKNDGMLRPIWEKPFDNRDCQLPYVLFPFQGQLTKDRRYLEKEKQPGQFIANGSFTLRIRFPKALRQDVETAVWAWVNFGGLGARTRRGCGSLYCQELAPKDEQHSAEWFKQAGPALNSVRDWPTLPSSLLVRHESGEPFQVWDRLIGFYKGFRQGEIGRNPGREPNRPGRSRYPEPDTIRRITGRHSNKHEPSENMPNGFPRAEFGLPIIFHFKDEKYGEPTQTTLNPFVDGEVKGRMASPLIIKPLALSPTKAMPLIFRLATKGIQQVDLQGENQEPLTPRHAVPVQDQAFALPGSPLHGLTDVGSALEAFMNYARNSGNGFEEVSR